MIRVLWPAFLNAGWAGGTNYFCNLARACNLLPNPKIQIVLLGKEQSLPSPLTTLPQLSPPCLQKHHLAWWANKVIKRISTRGGLMTPFLQRHNIAIASHHNVPLGKNSPIPSLCWIPDLQHKHLPHFFSTNELKSRDKQCKKIAESAQAVLLSSKDAQADFCHFYPEAAKKTHVLNFTASTPEESTLPKISLVHSLYGIAEPYFYIPNQLWVHKNHEIVIEALKISQSQHGTCPLVISTGHTSDYRNPQHFSSLQEKIHQAGLTARFLFLGLIPLEHVAVLTRNSIALINPSRFEGWSTTVEEAKSLGKKIILSDLAVHKEQAPKRGVFFNPDDAEKLATLIYEAQQNFDTLAEQKIMQESLALLPERMMNYGLAYEKIIMKVVATTARS